jgi:hypothetical protein
MDDVPLPEWTKQDDLGGLVPSEIRTSMRAYGAACAAAERARVIEGIRNNYQDHATVASLCDALAAKGQVNG